MFEKSRRTGFTTHNRCGKGLTSNDKLVMPVSSERLSIAPTYLENLAAPVYFLCSARTSEN